MKKSSLALIQGAAKAYAPTMADPLAFTKGAVVAGRGVSPSTLAGLQAKDNTDAKVKAYIDGLSTDMDLVDFSEAERNSIKSFLFGQKQRYAQLATEITQTDAMSSSYLELKNEMDGIKQSFLNLKTQTDKFKERKIQYLDDFDNGRISKGNKQEDYEIAGKVYGGGALLIDPNGGINVVVDGGKGMIRYSDVKDPSLKDFKTADEILKQNNTLFNAGVKLDPSKERLLKNQLKAKLSQEGALESIVEDKLLTDTRLAIDLDAYATKEQAIEDVTEMLLQGYRDSASTGFEQKRKTTKSFKPEDIAEAKNIIEIFNRPEEGALITGMSSDSNIVYKEGNWFPATKSAAVASYAPLTVARAINRLQIPPALYKYITGKDIPYNPIVNDPIVNDPIVNDPIVNDPLNPN